jgi:O-acetyl-ADP-ribose deacetylase (regulator of RNase III)
LIELVQGDITKQSVDVIVNAANSALAGGGGVDGAIHKAGGPQILKECMRIRTLQGGCPAGYAVITTAGKLQAKYVIHAVGPIWRGGDSNEAEILAAAYKNSLLLAVQYDCDSIAFPSISTGAYGYPAKQAAEVAIRAINEFTDQYAKPTQVRIVLFDYDTFNAYLVAMGNLIVDRPQAPQPD